jgi:hypothetical protein
MSTEAQVDFGGAVLRNTNAGAGRQLAATPENSAMKHLAYARVILNSAAPALSFASGSRETALILRRLRVAHGFGWVRVCHIRGKFHVSFALSRNSPERKNGWQEFPEGRFGGLCNQQIRLASGAHAIRLRSRAGMCKRAGCWLDLRTPSRAIRPVGRHMSTRKCWRKCTFILICRNRLTAYGSFTMTTNIRSWLRWCGTVTRCLFRAAITRTLPFWRCERSAGLATCSRAAA